jgi:hypothetical protein
MCPAAAGLAGPDNDETETYATRKKLQTNLYMTCTAMCSG